MEHRTPKKLRFPSENRDHFETNVVFQSSLLKGVWTVCSLEFFCFVWGLRKLCNSGQVMTSLFLVRSLYQLVMVHSYSVLAAPSIFLASIFVPHRKRGIPEIPKEITSLERCQPSCSFKLMVVPLKSAATFSTWNLYIYIYTHVEIAASRGFFFANRCLDFGRSQPPSKIERASFWMMINPSLP